MQSAIIRSALIIVRRVSSPEPSNFFLQNLSNAVNATKGLKSSSSWNSSPRAGCLLIKDTSKKYWNFFILHSDASTSYSLWAPKIAKRLSCWLTYFGLSFLHFTSVQSSESQSINNSFIQLTFAKSDDWLGLYFEEVLHWCVCQTLFESFLFHRYCEKRGKCWTSFWKVHCDLKFDVCSCSQVTNLQNIDSVSTYWGTHIDTTVMLIIFDWLIGTSLTPLKVETSSFVNLRLVPNASNCLLFNSEHQYCSSLINFAPPLHCYLPGPQSRLGWRFTKLPLHRSQERLSA